MATINNTTTFWNLLKEKVEIPIIQRDYAQGREGNEELRERFLTEIISALNGTPLVLDFVYGSNNGIKMNPLDGQQRLTTLYLLHWYLAYKSPLFEDEKENRLLNFTYETRVSSRDFCKALVNNTIELRGKDDTLSNTLSNKIKEQTWFFSEWTQDPTIKSMLTMIDCIDEKLKPYKEKWDEYKEKLLHESPISFYYLPLNDFGLSDDLYIKMNARGKQLTNFENFKADLIGYTKKIDADEEIPYNLSISNKLDNDWTDFFWINRKDGKIDAIYLAFLNRFFLNKLMCDTTQDAGQIVNGIIFTHLYGKESNDSNVEYKSFDIYKSLINEKTLEELNVVISRLNKENKKQLWKDAIDIIPQYTEDKSNPITFLKLKERVIFHAICSYFKVGEYDEKSYQQWRRVVRNIVENGGIKNTLTMIGCIRLIEELSKYSHNILEFMINDENKIESTFASEQVGEEREKAKRIIDNAELESKIIEAEETAFFNGAIRFLYRDGDRNCNWEQFEDKFKNANKYFNENGCNSNISVDLTTALIKCCTNWKQLYEQYLFNPKKDNWIKLLLNSDYALPIHNCLNTKDLSDLRILDFDITDVNGRNGRNIRNELINSGIIKELVENYSDFRLRLNYHHLGLYKSYGQNVITFDWPTDDNKGMQRNSILRSLQNEIKFHPKPMECKGNNGTTKFFWGWDIDFSYLDMNFRWYYDGNLYKMNHDWEYLKNGDQCININLNKKTCTCTDEFIAILNDLK